MFTGKVYDEFMISEVKVIRHRIIKVFPILKNDENFRLFLKANGEVGDTKFATAQEYEVPVDYYSESETETD